MRTVLVFSWFYLPYVGGAELFVREIVSRLSHRYRFVIVTARGDRSLAPRAAEGGAEILRVGIGARMDKTLYPLPALVKALPLRDVSLVHSIMVNASAVAAYLYCLFKRRPSLLTLQNGDSEEYVRSYLGPLFPIYPRFHRPFDRIHAISRHLREQAIGYGADASRITVIPNGVETKLFSRRAHPREEIDVLRERLGLTGRRVILSVSRLALKNGIEDMIRAMPLVAAKHPESILLLVGDGEDRARLERSATGLSIQDRVRFLGSAEQADVARYLCLADVFVRPSLSEGLGTAFLEALACEVPIVGTRVGGIPDFLKEGKTGLFCEAGNPDSIAGAVNRFLSDERLARDCAERGRALVESEYRWDTVAERIGALYDELLSSRAGAGGS